MDSTPCDGRGRGIMHLDRGHMYGTLRSVVSSADLPQTLGDLGGRFIGRLYV